MTPLLADYFELVGFKPNPGQEKAILHTTGSLFLVAGPGSGKTRVLLWRTLNLIVFHGVKPEEIFLATFTEKAAKQLKDGLLSLLGLVTNKTGQPFDLSKMYVGTAHSLCNRILTDRSFSSDRTRRSAPSVLDDLEQYFTLHHKRFWLDAISSLGLGQTLDDLAAVVNGFFEPTTYLQTSRHKAVASLKMLFNRFSEENFEPSDLLNRTDSDEMRLLVSLYDLYRKKLLEQSQTDFALLQQSAYQTINAEPSSRQIFKHVIIDEYQDTNAIQELIYFALASGTQNLCVVGDDEQALYRFRGATVENFVQFPERCQKYFGVNPTRIELNTNYRSRREVVQFYTRFMEQIDWSRPKGGAYRIEGKDIRAASLDTGAAVIASTATDPENVAREIAGLVASLIAKGKVKDPNQIAFLFPSLRDRDSRPNVHVQRMRDALEAQGLRIYAPRAQRFLEQPEPMAVLGLMLSVIGIPERNPEYDSGGFKNFHDWLHNAKTEARVLLDDDKSLKTYVTERKQEIEQSVKDFDALAKVMTSSGWNPKDAYDPAKHKRAFINITSLSDKAKRTIGAAHLDKLVADRAKTGQPYTLHYIVNRATSLDWSVLDLFYRILGFKHFKAMFDQAESGLDEGPVCNLSLVSKMISRFLDQTQSVLTASFLREDRLKNLFVSSYLYSLYRMGEGEFEDAEDPFPKGRIPFLTVHQAKGLEFPVVVLANPGKLPGNPQKVEQIVRPYLSGDPEPLERVGEFDTMRMYYVALSRAENLMVIANPSGRGQRLNAAFKPLLEGIQRIPEMDVDSIPIAKHNASDAIRAYSYTSDYLSFQECARRYMIFGKYEFASSRTQSMFFGNLVHQTIEDLHNRLIAMRENGASA